jgi:hypothetical protein
VIEKIEEMLRAEPFTPFKLIMSSSQSYEVWSPYQVSIGASIISYFFPKSDRQATLRKTELTTVETMEPSKN